MSPKRTGNPIRGRRIALAVFAVWLVIAAAYIQGAPKLHGQEIATTAGTEPASSTLAGSASPPAAQPADQPAQTGASATVTPSASAGASAPASATPTPAIAGEDDLPPLDYSEQSTDGGPSNRIVVRNRTDRRLRVRAKVQLNHISGDTASPNNFAEAFSSCDGCDTFAVALQIDLIGNTTQASPQNQAIALNYKCNDCDTVARALQYVVQVDDPSQVPDRARDLVDTMNDQLERLSRDSSVNDVGQAESVLNGVLAQFQDLAQNLSDQRDERTDNTSPGASPSP